MSSDSMVCRGLAEYFNTDKHSDFVIRCKRQIWKVHKVVLCSQSSFFRAACEGQFEEAHTGVLELKDDEDDPAVIGEMLKYMYQGNAGEYSSDESLKSADIDPALLHVRMYAAADKFGVQGLKALALGRFSTSLQSPDMCPPSSVQGNRVVAVLYSNPELYARHRKLLCDHCVRNPESMFTTWDKVNTDLHGTVERSLYEHPEFAIDLLKNFGRHIVREENMINALFER